MDELRIARHIQRVLSGKAARRSFFYTSVSSQLEQEWMRRTGGSGLRRLRRRLVGLSTVDPNAVPQLRRQ